MSSPLRSKSFAGLTGAQFLGAFNDNLFKQLLLLLAARSLFPGDDQQGIAFVVFAAPYILFSGIAGDLSEKVSKRSVIVTMKVAEIGIMALGAAALQARHWHALLAVLFVMGVHSAFFGPSKYGIIPELVDRAQLLRANGIIAMTTFLSILLGQALAGPLLDFFPDQLWVTGTFCTVFAALGFLSALRIERVPATRPDLRLRAQPFGDLFQTMSALRRQGHLFDLVLVNSMFWFNGSVILLAVNGLGPVLALGETDNKFISYLLANLATCIMVGCLLVPRLARVLQPPRLVALGAVCMVIGQSALVLIGPVLDPGAGYVLGHAALAFAGLTGAWFVVPVAASLQDAPEMGNKGKTFAVNNWMNFLLMFFAGAFYQAAMWLSVPPAVACAASGGVLLAVMGWKRKAIRVVR
jgi:MFS family permease